MQTSRSVTFRAIKCKSARLSLWYLRKNDIDIVFEIVPADAKNPIRTDLEYTAILEDITCSIFLPRKTEVQAGRSRITGSQNKVFGQKASSQY